MFVDGRVTVLVRGRGEACFHLPQIAILSEAVVTCLVRGIACKAILSGAVVTRDTVPGLKQYNNCLKDSTLLCLN